MFKPLSTLPPVSRDAGDILKLFGSQSTTIQNLAKKALGVDRPILGTDLEYSETVRYIEEPTVLGVSDGFLTVSVPFDEGITLFKELRQLHPNILFVGHAFTSADKFAFAQVGEVINLEDIEDTIIRFFLANAHLCKTGAKLEDGDGEKRGKGYMNLWTFLSIYTDFYNYKECHKESCRGEFCPKHDVWGYNGADASGPLFALPQLLFQSKVRGVDKLYPLHRELAYVLGEMSRFGVQVDREYLFGDKGKGTLGLQGEFELNKKRIEESLPFNPKSNKEAVAYFKGKGIELSDWQETTIREKVEEESDPELALCLDYKELGNGTDRWFAPLGKDKSGDWTGYLDSNSKIHPRLSIFTSTGRLAASSPNLQNVSSRRVDRNTCECKHDLESHSELLGCSLCVECKKFRGVSMGKMVRRAIIASPGHYLLSADFSNAENRMFLHLSGHHIPNEVDLHTFVAEKSKFTPDMEIVKLNKGNPREAAKTVSHGSMYLEGIQVKYPRELLTSRIRSEIDMGAREVWSDWKLGEGIVTFTGSNLSQRVFGDKTFANRKKALSILKILFDTFPGAREFQQKIGKQMEREKAVITPHGYYLLSFGPSIEDRIKTAAAMFGCLSPETLVLKSDLTWVPNGDLKVGDELIGIEEFPRNRKQHRRMLPSKVLSIDRIILPSCRVVTDKGEVICSLTHPWLTRTQKTGSGKWIEAGNLKVGNEISFLASPWEQDTSYEAGYLAGALDGEGTADRLRFYQTDNGMLQYFRELLVKKGFSDYRFSRHRGKEREAAHYKTEHSTNVRSLGDRLSLGGSIGLKRIDTRKLWEGVTPLNGRYLKRAKVLSVENIGDRELIGMETSTKTFVANGMFTHNSNPVAHLTKLALVDLWRKFVAGRPLRPILQIHDEILCEVSLSVPPEEAAEWLRESMERETPEIPGLILPIGNPSKGELANWGKNWADKVAIKVKK